MSQKPEQSVTGKETPRIIDELQEDIRNKINETNEVLENYENLNVSCSF